MWRVLLNSITIWVILEVKSDYGQFIQDDSSDDTFLVTQLESVQTADVCLWLSGEALESVPAFGNIAFIAWGHGTITIECQTHSEGPVMWKKQMEKEEILVETEEGLLNLGPGFEWQDEAIYNCYSIDRPDWGAASVNVSVTNYPVERYNISLDIDELYFQCKVGLRKDQILWASNVTWTHNNRPVKLHAKEINKIVISGNYGEELNVTKIQSEDSGIYKCQRTVSTGLHVRYFVVEDHFVKNDTDHLNINIALVCVYVIFIVFFSVHEFLCKNK